jgi:hypothetical protein
VLDENLAWVEHPHVLFAMPMTPDFGLTYQWMRELRRWHDERLIAVHLRLPSEEEVLVGRYNQRHIRMPLGEAIRRLLRAPEGNEIVVLRPVRAKEVARIQEVTQRVGWIETPEQHGKSDCLCPACLPHGARDLMRRVRGAMDVQLMAARRATTPEAIREALSRMHMPLERAKGRYPIDKLLVYLESDSAQVRAAATDLLVHYPWPVSRAHLVRQTADVAPTEVAPRLRPEAIDAAIVSGGIARAFSLISPDDNAALVRLMAYLAYSSDAERGARILLAIAKLETEPTLERISVMESTAHELLEESLLPPTRAALNALLSDIPSRVEAFYSRYG